MRKTGYYKRALQLSRQAAMQKTAGEDWWDNTIQYIEKNPLKLLGGLGGLFLGSILGKQLGGRLGAWAGAATGGGIGFGLGHVFNWDGNTPRKKPTEPSAPGAGDDTQMPT